MARLVTGRLTAWLVIVVALAGAGALIALAPDIRNTDDPTAGLPADAQSTVVAERQQDLPSGELNPALVVYSRPGGTLSPADLEAIAAQGPALGEIALGGRVSPPQPSADAAAAIVAVPLSGDASGEETVAAVEEIRTIARTDLPDGVIAQVTGGAGFVADINSAFDGADIRLLATTAVVVAVLLLITYRSPILWVVPLAVVGLADRVTVSLVAIASQVTDLPFDASTSGIVSVLVFGAGTDYALLLIARYREELRRTPDRPGRHARGLAGAAPAIAASAGTVILALLTLLLRGPGAPSASGPGWRDRNRDARCCSDWWCCPRRWSSARADLLAAGTEGRCATTRTARNPDAAGAGSAWPPPGGRSGHDRVGAAAGRIAPWARPRPASASPRPRRSATEAESVDGLKTISALVPGRPGLDRWSS